MKLREALIYEVDSSNNGQDEIFKKFVKKNIDFFKNLVQASKTNFAKDIISSGDIFITGTDNHSGSTYIGKAGGEKHKPVNNNDFVDDFVENYRKKHFPNMPSRQTSTFGVKVSFSKSLETPLEKIYNKTFIAIFKNGYKCFQGLKTNDLYKTNGNKLEILIKEKSDNKEIEKILNKHFNGGRVEFTSMKSDGKTEIIVDHKGYWAFESFPWLMTRKYLYVEKQVDILKQENIKKIIDLMK